MKIKHKLQSLRFSYLERMPDIILMDEKLAKSPDKTDDEWDQFNDLPCVYQDSDNNLADVLRVIRYENKIMYCLDPEDDAIYEFEMPNHNWMFPLEVLVEINENY